MEHQKKHQKPMGIHIPMRVCVCVCVLDVHPPTEYVRHSDACVDLPDKHIENTVYCQDNTNVSF